MDFSLQEPRKNRFARLQNLPISQCVNIFLMPITILSFNKIIVDAYIILDAIFDVQKERRVWKAIVAQVKKLYVDDYNF